MDFPTPQSPLIKGLVFKKKTINTLFRLFAFCKRKCPVSPLPGNPQKILICHFGHLGDLLIASKAIQAVKDLYHNATVSFLVSNPSKVLFGTYKIHLFDHFTCLKNSLGLCKAALHYIYARRAVLREIRAEQYDMAIDLHPYFPNTIPLIYAAKIPVRLGYSSGGFGSLLTHSFDWTCFGKYLADLHLDHLKKVGIPIPEKISHFFKFGVEELSLPDEFIVIHMCSSTTKRDWVRASWIELIGQLDCPVILMGHGEKDKLECAAVSQATGCINLCNQTTLSQYATILQKAKLLITVESMPIHLASLYHTPTILLFMEVNFPHLWVAPSCKACIFDPSVEKVLEVLCTL